MLSKIFKEVKSTAARTGADPHWLKLEEAPKFQIHEDPKAAGPELILLHGLLGALSNWDSVFPMMAKSCRPIAVQLPILTGHRSEVKVKSLASYIEFFIRQREMLPVALCGNSLGGHVAMRLCLAAPETVDCLILSGTSGLYEHSVDALPIRPDQTYIRDNIGRVFFNRDKFVTTEAVEEIYQILSSRMNVLNLIHAARSAKRDNLLHLLKQIKVPTLLLWGEEDEVTTMDVAETFNKNIPNSTLVSIKNCGHAPMIEHPEWFAEETKKFLEKHSRFYKKK
jgi:pimeloyl-ACP methyl ester carboxylesterase